MLLAAITVLGVVPFTPFVVSASAAEWEPDDPSSWTTLDNPILDALFYLDYRGGLNPGVRESLLNATLYYNSNTGSKHGNTTEIEHTAKNSGLETVSAGVDDSSGSHPSTADARWATNKKIASRTGLKPDVNGFRSGGFHCGAFVSYVYLNYFPNIAGKRVVGLADVLPGGSKSPATWKSALDKLVSRGQAINLSANRKIIPVSEIERVKNEGMKAGTKGKHVEGLVENYTLNGIAEGWDALEIGDILIMGQPAVYDASGSLSTAEKLVHIAIYAGKAATNGSGERHMMIDCGNSAAGPEIQIIANYIDGYVQGSDSKASIPLYVYHPTYEALPDNGFLDIIKTTTNGGTLRGWEFSIYSDAACTDRVAVYSTGDGGTIDNVELKPGTYYVKETGGYYTGDKSYWTMDTSVKEVTIEAGKTATVSFENKWTGKVLFAKTSTNGGTVEGWKFTVYYHSDGTGEIGTYTTGPDGTILTTGWSPGTYYVKETGAPDGVDLNYWTMDTSIKEVTVKAGETATVSFENRWTGKVLFKKTTTNGGTVAGWKLTAYYDKTCSQVIGTYTTGADGTILTGGWSPGTYYVKETGAPDGIDASDWKMDESIKEVTVKAGETATVTFENKFGGDLKIVKKATNGGTVADWEFSIYRDEDCLDLVKTVRTQGDGTISVNGLKPGTYYVKETGRPTHMSESELAEWKLDEGPKRVTVSAGETATVTFENKYRGDIRIVKTSTNGGTVAYWEFSIYRDEYCLDLVTTVRTQGDGTVIARGLVPGTYYVKETDAPPYMDKTYWVMDTTPKEVTVEAGGTATVSFENRWYGKLELVKISPTGGPVEGWKFKVYYDEECTAPVSDEEYTTGPDGKITITEWQPGTYYVKETGAPDGVDTSYWVMDENARDVTVKAGETASVTFINIAKGRISVKKISTNGGTVEGWQFTVYRDKDCEYEVGTYTTGPDGTITTELLFPGTYYVKETGAPAGVDTSYWTMENLEPKEVTVNIEETAEVSFTNKWFGRMKIVKTLKNPEYGTLDGWTFELRDSGGKLVGIYVTGPDGTITTENLEPGEYTLTEILDDHFGWFCLSENPRTVTIVAGETVSAAFENVYGGRIEMKKTLENPEAGTLDGWKFEVRDSKGTLVDTFISAADGTITTDWLEPGEYTVTEILEENSIWFCTSENPQTVTVVAGSTITVTFDNALRPAKLTVEKTDESGTILPGAEFLLEWSDDGTVWQPVSYTDSAFVKRGSCTSAELKDGILTVGADGKVVFEGLYPLHYYRLTEVAAPNGYQLLTAPVFEGKLEVENNFEAAYRVVNRPLPALPVTGGKGGLILPPLAACCAAIAFGLMVVNRKKKRR